MKLGQSQAWKRRRLSQCLIVTTFFVSVFGCSMSRKATVQQDDKLKSSMEVAREAYDEGDLVKAEKKYLNALYRSWAIDDPFDCGTSAYNLAACLTSQSRYQEALEWLVDARVELCRAKASTGNTWLLSAEIAMAQERFEDASCFVGYASRACAPCEFDDEYRLNSPAAKFSEQACKKSCWERIPVIGKKVRRNNQLEDCQWGYQARVELAKARLFAKQCDLCNAKAHLSAAAALMSEVCDVSLQADRHDVAALIYDLEENPLQAGAHRDRQIELLRGIGQYRELPDILDATANSYCLAGRHDLAIDRWIRSARIWLTRGEYEQAWRRVQSASEFVDECECSPSQIRLMLTAKLIELAISKKSPPEEPQLQDSTPK